MQRNLAFIAAMAVFPALAQIPTKCLEIESILVDACVNFTDCPFSQESHNEWVRFRVGPSPIPLSDLQVTWPNNPWQGFAQNATTAGLVAQMNAGIQGCGWLQEPVGGILPAGASVLLVTSTLMCPTANPFTNLSDTVHVLFQAAGNSTAHFLNHNNGPDTIPAPIGPPITRTLVITRTSTMCHDTATYMPQQLVNIYGNYGGLSAVNDGATAEFSWPGEPVVTYINNGCQAPYVPITVSIDPPVGSLCGGGAVQLSASVPTAFTSVLWSGGSGSFSDTASLNTTYTAAPNETGDVIIQFCAVAGCGAPVCDSITLAGGALPDVSIINVGPITLCTGGSVEIIANGTGPFEWNTGETGASIMVSSPGTYSVTSTNTCGTASASVDVQGSAPPVAAISGPTSLCAGSQATLNASGGDTYTWSTGTTGAAIQIFGPDEYYVVATNGCGSDTAWHTVIALDVQAAFTADVTEGEAPLEIFFLNLSIPDDIDYTWNFGDGNTTIEPSPTHTFWSAGTYVVTLTAVEGDCSSTTSVTITITDPPVVPEPSTESSVTVPNVFSPNGDGQNDVLEVNAINIASIEVGIYNRWGQRVYLIELPRQVWDGRSYSGEKLTEGTYFYDLRATGLDGISHELKGSITLVR